MGIDSKLYTQLVRDCQRWKEIHEPKRALRTTYLLDENYRVVSVGRNSLNDPERPYEPMYRRVVSEVDALLRFDGCLRDFVGKLTSVNIRLDANGNLASSDYSRPVWYMLSELGVQDKLWVDSAGALYIPGEDFVYLLP